MLSKKYFKTSLLPTKQALFPFSDLNIVSIFWVYSKIYFKVWKSEALGLCNSLPVWYLTQKFSDGFPVSGTYSQSLIKLALRKYCVVALVAFNTQDRHPLADISYCLLRCGLN